MTICTGCDLPLRKMLGGPRRVPTRETESSHESLLEEAEFELPVPRAFEASVELGPIDCRRGGIIRAVIELGKPIEPFSRRRPRFWRWRGIAELKFRNPSPSCATVRCETARRCAGPTAGSGARRHRSFAAPARCRRWEKLEVSEPDFFSGSTNPRLPGGSGNPCRSPAVRGKRRCRMHGGAAGSGAPMGNKNALRHGPRPAPSPCTGNACPAARRAAPGRSSAPRLRRSSARPGASRGRTQSVPNSARLRTLTINEKPNPSLPAGVAPSKSVSAGDPKVLSSPSRSKGRICWRVGPSSARPSVAAAH